MPGQTGRPRSGPAGWAELTARSLVETFEGSFETAGVVVAAACVDEAGAVIRVSPAGTPADGRLEIGSVTKTMTATLLALLAADGTLRLEDEVGRFLAAGANGGITCGSWPPTPPGCPGSRRISMCGRPTSATTVPAPSTCCSPSSRMRKARRPARSPRSA